MDSTDDSNSENFNIKEHVEKLKNQIIESSKIIEQTISKLGSFNVIANISYINHARDFTNYEDYQDNTLPIVSEYISLLCLKIPFSIGDVEFSDPHSFHENIQTIQENGIRVVNQVHFVRNIDSDQTEFNPTSIEEFARQFEREEYYVRNPAFDVHHWEVLRELYKKIDKEIQDNLGFNVDDAIKLCENIGSLVHRKVATHFRSTATYAEQQFYEILRYKAGGKLSNFYPPEILDKLTAMSKQDLKNHFRYMASLPAAMMLGQHYSFTLEEVIEESQLRASTVSAFLDALSISFEDVSIDFLEPKSVHPLKEKPIISGDGRYIVPSFSLLRWALDKVFEKKMQSTTKLLNKFNEIKSAYLVDKTLQLLSEIMPSSIAHRNLEFTDGANNGETDGLVMFDDCLFIVEGKSNKITDAAKEGKVLRVQKHIQDILSDAYYQGSKALDYIERNNVAKFKVDGRKDLEVRSTDFEHKFIIITTFEQISHIVSMIKHGNDTVIFNGARFPYAVSVFDLMVIKDIFDFGCLLPYYIQRRQEFFSNEKIIVRDEIDVLGNFLKSKLYTDHLDPADEATLIQVETFLDEFNRYYFYKEGFIRKAQPKPRFGLAKGISTFVTAMEKSELKGRMSYLLLLLSCNGDTQEEFIKMVTTMKRQFKRDRQVHDFSFTVLADELKWGITYFVGSRSESDEKLKDYCKGKLFQTKVDRWVGVMDTGTNGYQFKNIVILNATGKPG